jgi:hypothetical protein
VFYVLKGAEKLLVPRLMHDADCYREEQQLSNELFGVLNVHLSVRMHGHFPVLSIRMDETDS